MDTLEIRKDFRDGEKIYSHKIRVGEIKMATRETPTRLSETMRRMCEEYQRNQNERLYGRDELSAGNSGTFRTGEALRQVVRINTRDFIGIVRAFVDELAGDQTFPQAHLTIHLQVSDISSNYIARLWAGQPVIDGHTGEPVSSLDPTGERRYIQVFDTRVADLTLASNANWFKELSGRQCCEQEQRDLVFLLNERGVVVEQREPITISLSGFYKVIVDFYRSHHH